MILSYNSVELGNRPHQQLIHSLLASNPFLCLTGGSLDSIAGHRLDLDNDSAYLQVWMQPYQLVRGDPWFGLELWLHYGLALLSGTYTWSTLLAPNRMGWFYLLRLMETFCSLLLVSANISKSIKSGVKLEKNVL